MDLNYQWGKLKRRIDSSLFSIQNRNKEKFTCPICRYHGPFADINPNTGYRKHAVCPNCGAKERRRLQYLVVNETLSQINPGVLKMLHFAPEPFFSKYFRRVFAQYETADLLLPEVDHHVDLQNLPFDDQSYDFVFASHVLEHIPDDHKAISEIRRILKPNGIAILPVPIVAETTIEYPEPREEGHRRAPGCDYYDRYNGFFTKVNKFTSDSLPAIYQLFTYEDRTRWPTEECPLRRPMPGEKHNDIVPVCHV